MALCFRNVDILSTCSIPCQRAPCSCSMLIPSHTHTSTLQTLHTKMGKPVQCWVFALTYMENPHVLLHISQKVRTHMCTHTKCGRTVSHCLYGDHMKRTGRFSSPLPCVLYRHAHHFGFNKVHVTSKHWRQGKALSRNNILLLPVFMAR